MTIAPSIEKGTKTTALLDGDIIAYKAAAASDGEQEDVRFACRLADKIMYSWVKDAGCEDYRLCMSLGQSFRYRAYPEYKHNRKGKPRPTWLGEVRDYLRHHHEPEEQDTWEADDIMGVLATDGSIDHPVIVTIDKDLQQIPGWHFNPDKHRHPIHVRLWEADLLEHIQWAAGDATDGFKGLEGIGVAKALKRLREDPTASEMTANVTAWYEEKGYTPEYRDNMRVCSRIMRVGLKPPQ